MTRPGTTRRGASRLGAVAGVCLALAAGLLVVLGVHVSPRPYVAATPTAHPRHVVAAGNAPPSQSYSGKPAKRPKNDIGRYGWFNAFVLVAVGLLVVVAAAGVGGLLSVAVSRPRHVHLGRSARRRAPPPAVRHTGPPDPAAAAEAALAAVDRGTAGDAIIACWLALHDAAFAAGLRPHPADSPQDFVIRVLAGWPVPRAAIDELAGLYREARFSRHAMTDDDRRAARAALLAIRAGLRTDAHV